MTDAAHDDAGPDLSHLSPRVAALALQDDDKRRAFIERDQFVHYQTVDGVFDHLQALVNLPDTIKPRSYIVVGESQMGKSAILQTFESRHPADDNPQGEAAIVPVLRIQYPESQGDGIYGEIIRTLNGSIAASAGPAAYRKAALSLLGKVGMRVLIVDELANVFRKNTTIAMNSIKFIMNELKRPVVLGATKEAYELITQDRQIKNRFQVLTLPRLKNDHELVAFLNEWEQILPLRKPSQLAAVDLRGKIHSISQGLVGNIVSVLKMAATEAIGAEEQITVDLIDEMGWVSQDQADAAVRDL